MRIASILLLLCLLQQEDVTPWIEKLRNDSIEIREAATRHLQDLELSAVERLEKAQTAERDPEVRARLSSIIAVIRKRAQLAKVFGPAKRFTGSARGRKLEEMLKDLEIPGEPAVKSGTIDQETPINVELKSATWWEALDRIAEAAGARVAIRRKGDQGYSLKLVPTREPPPPAMYLDQFRFSVIEVKRFEVRSPAGPEDLGLVVAEVSFQPNLRPVSRYSGEALRIDSVRDANGTDSKVERPSWLHGWAASSRPLGYQLGIWVRADAAFPLTIEGKTDISFQADVREISVDVAGEGNTVKVGPVTLSVVGCSPSKDAIIVTIRAEAKGIPDFRDGLIEGSVVLEDSQGHRHTGRNDGRTRGREYGEWAYHFPADIKEPRKIHLRWVAEFYRAEIPFRLEGVRLP